MKKSKILIMVLLPLVSTITIGSFAQSALMAPPVENTLHDPVVEHVDQFDLQRLILAGKHHEAFKQAFELGDELFEAKFNAWDGAGANVGNGSRFTRVPRADLSGADQWANHIPPRPTGPNAQACSECHSLPFDDGAGPASANVHRDPAHTANLGQFVTRNTPHLFGIGAIQRLTEEMTDQLIGQRRAAEKKTCLTGQPQSIELDAKGIDFGSLSISRVATSPCRLDIDTSGITGVNADLVVMGLQWKGSDANIRKFNREASNNEIGMQAVELVGSGIDGDFDGIVDEMTIGDQTAMAIYVAAQPRPTSKLELKRLGFFDLSEDETKQIEAGKDWFAQSACATCHQPSLTLDEPVFYEPSLSLHYRDISFPGGQDPIASGVDPALPVQFDLTRDQPDNVIKRENGHDISLGSFEKNPSGGAIIELYGDLKWHEMGATLAEPIDEAGTGNSVWMTKELWGLGSTAPYLHDGRATTLSEAILAHGGEAESARLDFINALPETQSNVLAFLDNLILYKQPEEDTAQTTIETGAQKKKAPVNDRLEKSKS